MFRKHCLIQLHFVLQKIDKLMTCHGYSVGTDFRAVLMAFHNYLLSVSTFLCNEKVHT